MSGPERDRVPTLTEVVSEGADATAAVAAVGDTPPERIDAQAVAARVLVEVERRIDATLESRLRERLAPVLARASDALMREMRAELETAMRDVVAESVEQALARERERPSG